MAGEDNTDILTQAAADVTKMTPQLQGPATMFGPRPIVAPPPPIRFQPPQIQHAQAGNEFSTVSGNKRATKQALFHGVASFIKAGGDYIQQKKQRALSMDIGQLMDASQGIQEAQAALQANPNDAQAREALQRNQSIINTITSDPKKVKQLQKAFNIDLFGNGKNKQENAALVDAWKNYSNKKSQGQDAGLNPIAQRLMQQQPMRLQMSPQMQQQAAMIQAGLTPKAAEVLKANVEVFKSYQTAQSAADRDAAIDKAAQIRANAQDRATQAAIDNTNVRVGGQKYAADIKYKADKLRANTALKETQMRVDVIRDVAAGKNEAYNERTKSLEKIANDKNTTNQKRIDALQELNRIKSGQTIMGGLAKQAEEYNKTLKTLTTDTEKLEHELAEKKSSFTDVIFGGHSDADKKRIAQNIGRNKAMINDVTDQLNQLQQQMDTINKAAMGNAINLGTQQTNVPQASSEAGTTEDNPIDYTPAEESAVN